METGKHHETQNHTSRKYKVGLVYGTFDPLHYGHIRLFKRAKEHCETLYVITEDDDIIRKEKHEPFTTAEDRVEDLKSIKEIDGIGLRSEKFDRAYWTRSLKADVLFLGSDWKDKEWEGKSFGIPIIYLDRTPDISSTKLRKCTNISKQTGQTKDTDM